MLNRYHQTMTAATASSSNRPAFTDEIRRLLQEGASGVEIVRRLGCSKGTVSYHAGKLGLKRPAKIHDWVAVQVFLDAGHSVRACRAKFGLSWEAIQKAQRIGDLVLPPRPRTELQPLESHFKRRNTPKRLGEIYEVEIALRLLRAGLPVFRPIGETPRCDLIFENSQGALKKVQVKTGRKRDGVITFNAFSTGSDKQHTRRLYVGEVDFFAVYCPDNGESYLIAADEVGTMRQISLRCDQPRNQQGAGVRWAGQYLLSRVTQQQ
jgi:PD-(D/E)XK endonuclease